MDDKWCVIKVKTVTGDARIGIDYSEEYDEDSALSRLDLTEKEADAESKRISKELGIPLFDNNDDILDYVIR